MKKQYAIEKNGEATILFLKQGASVRCYLFSEKGKNITLNLMENKPDMYIPNGLIWLGPDFKILRPYLLCILQNALDAFS